MSRWTSVDIRIIYTVWRGLLSHGHNPSVVITSHYGPIATFHSPTSVYAACSLPMGSEGSLRYDVQKGYEEQLNFRRDYEVHLWGSLRSYEQNAYGITKWLEKTVNIPALCPVIGNEVHPLVYSILGRVDGYDVDGVPLGYLITTNKGRIVTLEIPEYES